MNIFKRKNVARLNETLKNIILHLWHHGAHLTVAEACNHFCTVWEASRRNHVLTGCVRHIDRAHVTLRYNNMTDSKLSSVCYFYLRQANGTNGGDVFIGCVCARCGPSGMSPLGRYNNGDIITSPTATLAARAACVSYSY